MRPEREHRHGYLLDVRRFLDSILDLAAIIVQGLGYLFDVFWHGVLNPGREPTTVAEMVRHLATVHLPLYVGALLMLVTTAWAVARHARHGPPGRAPYVALAGAALSAGAEAWHAAEHLQLDTHTAPVAGILTAVGYLIVVGAMALSGRPGKRHRRLDVTV